MSDWLPPSDLGPCPPGIGDEAGDQWVPLGPQMTPDHVYRFHHADGRTDGEYLSVTQFLPTHDYAGWTGYEAGCRAVDTWGHWAAMGDRRDAVRYIAAAAEEKRDAAADLGTRVHAWCECTASGFTMGEPDDPEIRGHAREFERFLSDWQPNYLHVEQAVFSPTHRYAGRFDAIAEIDGLGVCMLDYKTGRSVYGSVALQLAAYANADYIGLPDGTTLPVPPIDNYVVLHLRPRSHHLLPITVTNPDTFRAFLYSQQVHLFNATADRLVGPALLPGRPTF